MSEIDTRFDEAEADVERGEPWRYREPGAPNPLTFEAVGWSTGHTRLGDADFLLGVDRDGKKWSVLVGSIVLKKRLIAGVVEEWDDAAGTYVTTRTDGRVQPGEIVSINYLGDREGSQYDYPDFRVSRKPATTGSDGNPSGDIPFQPTSDGVA